jgi:DNA-directed RNA polymerase specialized sigma24 family protein
MRQKRKPRARGGNNTPPNTVAAEEKIARLLGIIATKDLDRNRQVMLLRGAGFKVEEIAEMLGVSANNVRVASHYGRRNEPKKLKKSNA